MKLIKLCMITLLCFCILGCQQKTDMKEIFLQLSRNHLNYKSGWLEDYESYAAICTSGYDCLVYTYSKLDASTTNPYQIKRILFIDQDKGTDKPYEINPSDYTIISTYDDEEMDNFKEQLKELLEKTEMTIEEVSEFMLWYRSSDVIAFGTDDK